MKRDSRSGGNNSWIWSGKRKNRRRGMIESFVCIAIWFVPADGFTPAFITRISSSRRQTKYSPIRRLCVASNRSGSKKAKRWKWSLCKDNDDTHRHPPKQTMLDCRNCKTRLSSGSICKLHGVGLCFFSSDLLVFHFFASFSFGALIHQKRISCGILLTGRVCVPCRVGLRCAGQLISRVLIFRWIALLFCRADVSHLAHLLPCLSARSVCSRTQWHGCEHGVSDRGWLALSQTVPIEFEMLIGFAGWIGEVYGCNLPWHGDGQPERAWV